MFIFRHNMLSCSTTLVVFLVQFHSFASQTISYPDFDGFVPGMTGGVQFMDGDILIAGLFEVRSRSETFGLCNNKGLYKSGLYRNQAFVYAIDKINKNSTILPNVTLGYVYLDACMGDVTALARSLYLIPDKRTAVSSCLGMPDWSTKCDGRGKARYDVAGVVGIQSSNHAKLVSPLLGLFQIPHISTTASSNSFSNKRTYPYFLRTIPPDRYQVDTFASVLLHFNWTYVSTVYQAGAYGADGIRGLKEKLKGTGVCFAVEKELASGFEGYDDLAQDLIKHNNARVIILFSDSGLMKKLFDALVKINALDQFVFIASESISSLLSTVEGLKQIPLGLLALGPRDENSPEFDEYFKSLSSAEINGSYILEPYWEDAFGCSFSNKSNMCAPDLYFTEEHGFVSDTRVTRVIDTVSALAYAIDQVVQNNCSGVPRTLLRDCVKGHTLLAALKNIRYEGKLGNIEFDEAGDPVGIYEVKNIQFVAGVKRAVRVAMYVTKDEVLVMDTGNTVLWPGDVPMVNGIPESVCSHPCRLGYQRIQRDVPCCWECRKCRENEQTNLNQSECIKCPKFHWPDQTTFMACLKIPADFLKWSDIIVMLMLALEVAGAAMTIAVFALFTKYRETKLIKASSTELMYMILIGVVISLFVVISFLSLPTLFSCYLSHFGFHVTFSMCYAPLVVKTRRIFAIFDAGKKSTKPPMMISSKSQILVSTILVALEIVICTVVAIADPPVPRETMPSPIVEYVELGCNTSMIILLTPLIYNLILVLTCTAFAFKARKVPSNFNESRFISFSVYTTLILWMAFIPTYFTSNNSGLKVIYLTIAMFINAFVIHICLFIPKLYAVMYIEENELNLLQSRIGTDNNSVGPPPSQNAVSKF